MVQVTDIHAHVTPERFKKAIAKDGTWHGLGPEAGELNRRGFTLPLEDRLAEMDATGIDRQLITPTQGFYQYGNDLDTTTTIARECNEEIAAIVDDHPDRFSGLGTVPMQDVPAAIAELTRAMTDLNLKGAMISDHVVGRTYDEPEFLPFFKAAEALGAVLFIHQGADTIVKQRINRYSLPNGVGNPTERTLSFAALVFGGVMDECPNLKVLLAHGGGYTAFGIGRLDKIAGALESDEAGGPLTPPFPQPEGEYRLTRAPSSYLDEFFYDCVTYNGAALRFLVDSVGIDRVMLGTDYPAPMFLQKSVQWINGLTQLTSDEKEAILRVNSTAFLGL
jgi:aminocarboxymuconate-semialdehyde decarboxylase